MSCPVTATHIHTPATITVTIAISGYDGKLAANTAVLTFVATTLSAFNNWLVIGQLVIIIIE